MPRGKRTSEEWLLELHEVIQLGEEWIRTLPPRSANEVLMANAAKQLADEACQFASAISNAIQRNHKVAAYANLRPLVDRLLHATRFFETPKDNVDWMYWSVAEINRSVNNALSQRAVNKEDRDAVRALLRDIRHWNRPESGPDCQMLRPGQYPWQKTLKAITEEANPRLKIMYDVASTYLHPTYRGSINTPDLGTEYVLEQATWITSAIMILCGATLFHSEEDWDSSQVNPHLVQMLETQLAWLTESSQDTIKKLRGVEDISDEKMLYLYGAMLVSFVFRREVIKGQLQLS